MLSDGPGMMSLQTNPTAASTREQYIAVLKVTTCELKSALCRLAHDEGLPQPFRATFRDQRRLYSPVAEMWIHDTLAWTKEPEARHLACPSGTLISADGQHSYTGNARIVISSNGAMCAGPVSECNRLF
jgi:hypothetical protein